MNRRMMTGLVTVFAACLAYAVPATAEPAGTWLRETGSSRIRVASCGGALCGTITWLKEPRNDVNNPDAAKKKKPLLGTTIFFGMKPSKSNQWKGNAYNPEDGKTYTGYMTLQGENSLKTQGCALGGLVCRSVTWTRVK